MNDTARLGDLSGIRGRITRNAALAPFTWFRVGRPTFSTAEMGFTYRHSTAPADVIFVAGLFEGTAAERAAIRAEMDSVEHHRETAQPIREKTGGSTFTNPPGKKAWQLIDAAGC